jgi:hypothetical protein
MNRDAATDNRSMVVVFIFTLPSALAQNIGTMLIARLVSLLLPRLSYLDLLGHPLTIASVHQLAGTASSAPMTNCGGTLSDIWAVEERGIPMAVFSATLL